MWSNPDWAAAAKVGFSAFIRGSMLM